MNGSWQPWLLRNPSETIAHDDGHRTTTNGALFREARSLASFLERTGIEPGERVALLCETSLDTLISLHAAQLARVSLVPLNDRLPEPDLRRLLDHARPKLLLYDEAHRTLAERIGTSTALAATSSRSDGPPAAVPHREDVLTVVYTSGTTGEPKGALLSNANYEAGAGASCARLGCVAGDRWLAAMPMSHVGGLSILVRAAITGMTVVTHRRFEAGAVATSLGAEGIQFVSLVPTMLGRVLDRAGNASFPNTLKAVVLGGGPLTPRLVQRAVAQGLPIVSSYGMTETAAQVTTSTVGDAREFPGTAGKPLDGVRLRIDKPDSEGVGEVCVQAPQVVGGYLDDEPRSHEALRNGWLRTGDLGRIDSGGRLWIEARRDDLIVSGGENVRPAEIETMLAEHPAVREVGVFALPDEEWGQVVAAAVVGEEALSSQDLSRWCGDRLARHKRPRAWLFLDELPRTTSGKLQRHRLVEIYDRLRPADRTR